MPPITSALSVPDARQNTASRPSPRTVTDFSSSTTVGRAPSFSGGAGGAALRTSRWSRATTYPFFAQIVSAFSVKEKFTKYSQQGLKTSAGKSTLNSPRESGSTAGTSNVSDATTLPFSSSSQRPS